MGKVFTSAEFELKSKDRTKEGLDSAKRRVGKLTQTIKSYGAEIGAAVGMVYAAIKVIKKLTEAYKIQETAVAKMEAALKATGAYSPTLSKNLRQLAKDLQSVTIYGDEATLEMTSLLQSLAKLNQEQLVKIIPAIQDFSTGMGVDLNTAASLVGKTLGSTTNALSRYGIVIDMTGTKEEKLKELTEAINASFGGMAEAMGDTYTGQVTILKNAFGDLKEEMGEMVAQQMKPMIPLITTMIQNLTAWIEKKNELREAYELLKKEMKDVNDYMRLEILEAEQLVAIDEKRILIKKLEREERKAALTGSLEEVRAIEKEIDAINKESRRRAQLIDNMKIALQQREEEANTIKENEKKVKDAIDERKKALNELVETMEWAWEAESDLTSKAEETAIKYKYLMERQIELKDSTVDLMRVYMEYHRIRMANIQGIDDEEKAVTDLMDVYKEYYYVRMAAREAEEESTELTAQQINLVYAQARGFGLFRDSIYNTEDAIDDYNEKLRETQRTLHDVSYATGLAINTMMMAWNTMYANKRIELEDWYYKEKEYLEKTITNEEDLEAAMKALDDEMEERTRKAMREEAQAKKKMAIFSTVINTARGIAESFPRFWKMAAIAAAGVAQLAIIKSQKIPAFQYGGIVPGGYGGGDTIPAMLEPGEMVVRKEVVRETLREGGGGEVVFHISNNIDGFRLNEYITRAVGSKGIPLYKKALTSNR